MQNFHNDYPLAPEKIEFKENTLSDYCKKIANKHNISVGGVKKFVPNISNKDKCVFPDQNLQLCLQLRMRLTETHRVSKFKQSQWLKKYTDFNSKERKETGNKSKKHAENKSEIAFFKLMNNWV